MGVVGHCDANATYPTYPGYTLNLVEDFPAPIDLDNDPILTWSDGSPVDGQTRFRKEQISFASGKMIITAQPPDGCAPQTGNAQCIDGGISYAEPAPNMSTGMVGKMGIWSGEVRTKYNNYRYGRYEAKYHAPANTGGFLSTLFVFRTPKWTIWNEIDNELEPSIPTSVAGNVVFGPQGYTGYPNATAQNDAWSAMIATANYMIADEHVYAFTWTPTEIDWYLDGNTTPIQTFKGKSDGRHSHRVRQDHDEPVGVRAAESVRRRQDQRLPDQERVRILPLLQVGPRHDVPVRERAELPARCG